MSTTHIIIVNYNAGEWLSRCLGSVLQYTESNITVVDNNSTDNSTGNAQASFANQPRLSWELNSENIGFAAANNQVLENLNADFALLLNPDCEINENTLPVMLSAFEQNEKLAIASCCIYNEDGSVQNTCRRRFPTPWTSFVRLLQLHRLFPNNAKFANFDYGEFVKETGLTQGHATVEPVEAISGACMMIRHTAINEIGLLDEAYFMHCEDLDWCKRVEQSRWYVGFVGAASIVHAKGISSQSRPIKVLWTLHKGMNRFFDKHYYHQYSFPVRLLVKVGIICSFILRSTTSLVKNWVN